MRRENLFHEKSYIFTGYDRQRNCRNGLPVKIILEADNDGIVLTAVRRKLTDIELMEICNSADGCEDEGGDEF